MHGLDRPATYCVHFVRTDTSSKEEQIEAARKVGVKFAYWNYLDGGRESATLADPLGAVLGLEHVPYGRHSWVQFLDDLITLAYRYDGLVIVVDRADVLVTEKSDEMFDLMEAFLTQFHHWYDQKKPCHLCFQMVEDEHLASFFTREAELRK